ncbi:anthrone oxygenase family protein [Streptomyces sp. NPDC002104]
MHTGAQLMGSNGTRLSTALLGLSTVLVGLMAGLFFAFDVSVMPGLAKTDDRTYVTAMQSFNAVIDGNPLFGTVFVVALLAAFAAAFVEARAGRRTVALWASLAAAAYLVVLVVTFVVNIPLNNELADLGDAAKLTDFSVVAKFKGTWETANIVRTLLCTAALTALGRALVLYGRATGAAGATGRGAGAGI